MRDMNYRVTIACGHRFKVQERPFRENSTYACKYTPSCGYRLLWTQFEDLRNGSVFRNEEAEAKWEGTPT